MLFLVLLLAAGTLLYLQARFWDKKTAGLTKPFIPMPDHKMEDRPVPDAERTLTSRLLAGELDAADYRDAMADLAAEAGGDSFDAEVSTLVWHTGDDPRLNLGRLGAALPELRPDVLSAAYVLACQGASADSLVRILQLTRKQAVTIVTSTRTAKPGPPAG